MAITTARTGRSLVVPIVAAVLLIASLFSLGTRPATAASCIKTYSVSIPSQSTFVAGGSGSFTLRFTNTAQNCTSVNMGSIKVSIPSGWSVASATPGAGWAVVTPSSVTDEIWLAASSGTAKIANGRSLDVVVSATSPSTAACGPSDPWRSRAWVATDFTSSTFTTNDAPAVTISCAELAFASQPATAERNTAITSVPGDPSGTPAVQVSASTDGDPAASVTVTLTIGNNPSAGTLSPSPATATTDANGIATFTGITIDKSGEGYTLVAAATGFSSATSKAFDIVDDYVDCNGQPCSGSATGGGTSGQIDANTDPSFLTVSILAPGTIDCDRYFEVTGTVAWKTDDQGNQIGTITADASLVKKLRPPDQGAAHFQVCFSPDPGKSFVDRNGNTVGAGQAGLLPDCTSSSDTNCIFFRNKTGAGSAVVRFRVADGKARI